MPRRRASRRIPEPQVAVQAIPNGLSVQIAYTALAQSGQQANLSFDVTP